MSDRDSVIRMAREGGFEALDLKFCDLNGRWHHITLPARKTDEDLFENGVGFDGSSVAGFTRLESGDLVVIPDPSTAFRDPFMQAPTLSLICDIAEADTREPFGRDPRGVARKAEEILKASGFADLSLWGPEFEFYVFDSVATHNKPNLFGAEMISEPPENRAIATQGSAYHALPPVDRHHEVRAAATRELEAAGVSVYYHHHEVGARGQCEIEIDRLPLTRAGDVSMMVKYFVRMCAERMGRCATFMPKPIYGEAGSGMHFHQHLFKGGKPVFYGKGGYADLSGAALNYIAGILNHGRSLSALTNPSTNAYCRLVPGYEAPVNLFFSLGNRSAAIRVPKYASSPAEKRIEYRPPDATCNPYIAMAAMLLAGIEGMKRKLDPTALGFGPFDADMFHCPEDKRPKVTPLPRTLDEALDALKEDHVFLLEGGAFTEDLISAFVKYKHDADVLQLSRRPHPMEIELYFDA